MSAQPLDTPERVLAFPLTGTRLIEASAGTGKTYTIANLYLRQVAAGRGVGDLLVVTFTEAATDELRGRIRARLVEALALLDRPAETDDVFLAAWLAEARAGDPQTTARTLRLAVRSMDEAAIYTIHGFCQRALTEFAFNSGQQFRLEVLTDDGDLWRAALQDWWRRTGYPLAPVQAQLFQSACGGFDAFATLVGPLLQAERRALLPHVDALEVVFGRMQAAGPTIAGLASDWVRDGERLREILRQSKGLSRAQASPYQSDNMEAAFVLVGNWFAACAEVGEPLPPPQAFVVLTPQSFAEHRLKKPDPALDDPYFQRCGELWDQLRRLRRDLRAAALAEAAAFARDRVHGAKQQAQVLAFDDLLTELHQALDPDLGGRAAALAESIRRRFPAAMIDEFQDTDPVQYGIFRRLYVGQPEVSLIMIGDPKQAIYSFRGGDIFTYMRAKADLQPGALYTLGTNWRSTPEVIGAVNRVFDRRVQDAFVYGEAIPFAPVQPADKAHQRLRRAAAPQPALTLWTLPVKQDSKGNEKGLSKDDARDRTHAAVAQEVAQLIREGRAGLARLAPELGQGGKDHALRPKDIAILVRGGFEAIGVRQALAQLGVAAVSVERSGVFASPEAVALAPLLGAVLDPRDRDLARLALASPLVGKGYAEVEAIIQGEDAWAAWQDHLLFLQETWQRRGFMAMFQAMLQRLGIGQALARDPDAERRLTNLLHLGELLQQASKTQAGMDALVGWYRVQLGLPSDRRGAEATELRLESDAELVQIVTVHSAKGLEYPVVFVPYLWGCKVRDTKGLVGFHRGDEALLDAGSDEIETNLRLAEQERLAEDVRLVYVALTRARSALYLIWGRAGAQAGHAGQTALGWLLHPYQTVAQLADQGPDAFSNLTSLAPDLADLADEEIRIAPLPENAYPEPLEPAPVGEALAPRCLSRPVSAQWRVTSFSELTRNVHPGPTPPRDPQAQDPAARFPSGSQVGSYLHLLLELTDFSGDVRRQILAQSARCATRFGLDHGVLGEVAAAWLERVTRTPLNSAGLTLAGLGPAQRMNELAFDFAVARVDMGALNRALQAAADVPLPDLEAEDIAGMVTGVIDLVFEHGGRWYIADYKSNYLGPSPADYGPECLAVAIQGHRYDLQALLYTLALHRYLRGRIPGYDYGRHFGGAYYLFLRGMHPDQGTGSGVHFSRPDPGLVEVLDREVFRWETVAA